MGAKEFGRLVNQRMQDRGWTQAYLAWRLSEPPDRIWNETMVRRLRLGQRHLDPHLVQRLIEIFELDEAAALEAWHAAGLWPPGLTVEDLRRLHTTPASASAEPVVAESTAAASAQSGTQRKGSPTRQPAPVAAVAA